MENKIEKKTSDECKHSVQVVRPEGIICNECKILLTTHFDHGREPEKLKGFPNKVT